MKASPFLFLIFCCASITDNEILNDRCSKVLLFSGLLEGMSMVYILFVGLEILEEIPQIFLCVFLKFKVSNWGFKDEVYKNTHKQQ